MISSFPSLRVPGIRFENQPPPLADPLPRMDVAALLGFASRGPVGVPVVVEDVARFEEVFGADYPLAWNAVREEPVVALLAPTVRAYFANGGRRCWVVRVAGQAASREFTLPSAVLPDTPANSQPPAVLQARSPGHWADDLTVTLGLESEELPVSAGRLGIHLSAVDLLWVTTNDRIAGQFAILAPDGVNLLVFDSQTVPVVPSPMSLDSLIPKSASLRRLTLVLEVRDSHNRVWRLDHLGLLANHPRWWRSIPNDQDWFGLPDEGRRRLQAHWSDCDHPRFPLAGSRLDTEESHHWQTDLNWLLRLKTAQWESLLAGERLPLQERRSSQPSPSALVRDGLMPFSPSLFIDWQSVDRAKTLLQTGASRLLEEWTAQSLPATGTPSTGGLFALLGLEEVTLVGLPDAVHLGWSTGSENLSDQFPSNMAAEITESFAEQPPPDSCLSATADFRDCAATDAETPAAPRLFAVGPAELPHWLLAWKPIADATYRIEQSRWPDFRLAKTVADTSNPRHTPTAPEGGAWHFRVRAVVGGVVGAPSNIVTLSRPRVSAEGIESPALEYDPTPLIALQRVVLRICAARGDLQAVLSVPRHYQSVDVLGHLGRLRGTEPVPLPAPTTSPPGPSMPIAPLGGEGDLALAGGGLYHPWLRQPSPNPPGEQTIPPDGATLGLMARRALSRGAWVAPANEAPRDVRGVDPWCSAADLAPLRGQGVNLWIPDRDGARLWSAITLHPAEAYRQLNVRRLLQLLRRLLRREGTRHAFEPNDAILRRTVERTMTLHLDDLFRRGAFAGAAPASAYQVLVEDQESIGSRFHEERLIVELRVAPSRPLEFLTVRLTQWGGVGQLTEGR